MLKHETLLQTLGYDPASGHFCWLVKRKGRKLDGPAGSLMSHGYIAICIDRRDYTGHRLAWFYVHGSWPRGVIDHINGDRADNRIANLRDVTQVENMLNVHEARRDSATGLRGVSLHKRSGKYTARLKIGQSYKSLGLHATPELAQTAYLAAKALIS